MTEPFPYEDIIGLSRPPHPKDRPPMSMHDRAAQFAPFAALAGYSEMVTEAARVPDDKWEEPAEADELNRQVNILRERIGERPEVTVTYFEPDVAKPGGRYVTVTGRALKLRDYEGLLELEGGHNVPLKWVSVMRGEVFGD